MTEGASRPIVADPEPVKACIGHPTWVSCDLAAEPGGVRCAGHQDAFNRQWGVSSAK